MALYKIAQIGNPVLSNKAKALLPEGINLTEIQTLIDNLIENLLEEDGVGIAAPQISVDKRIIVINNQATKKSFRKTKIPLTVIINPEITSFSKALELDWEGCLSVANGNLLGLVPRYKKIKVSGLDRLGKKITIYASSFKARVIQHEIDHLNGILFVQKIRPQDLRLLANRREWMKHYKNLWPKPRLL